MPSSLLSRRSFLCNTGLAALALPCRNLFASTVAPVTIRTAYGVLRGEQSDGVNVFRGVPFAEPPVGALRFHAPVKAKSWSGERDASRFAAAAMQAGEPKVEQSEDCLYLNVWTPQVKGPFPVYVWIHGGGFTGGNAFEPMYDGTQLAKAGIVCVTIPYRLGVFGFLDLEPLLGASYAGSANNALRDLIAALEWVQENIADFGGDPSRVTVGGESAGAKLTDILLGTPSAQPLFQQAISESGGAERVSSKDESAAVAQGFGERWRIENQIASLSTAAAASLIQVQQQFLKDWPRHFPLRAAIDGNLLPQLPIETIAASSKYPMRLLIGTNRDESALFIGPHPASDPVAGDLGNLLLARFNEVFGKYREIYPQMTDEQRRIRAVTAEEYWIPTIRVADALIKGGGKTWMYRLDFAERSGRMKGYAFHSLDVRLVWDRPSAQAGNVEEETALAHKMNRAWIAFIRGEHPGGQGLPVWPEYSTNLRPTMALGHRSHIEQTPQEQELKLWNGVL